ncbi:MAG: hypothetical protein K0U12_07850 [Gammaproteobacteria bacterium]|nr:hypothetical protein [Gammaproteobacteria bacterium]
MQFRQRGVSILEALLFITIAAIILALATRYAATALRNLHEQRAIRQIQHLTDVSYEWLSNQKQMNFSCEDSSTGCKAIGNTELTEAGLISANDLIDPWGGNITIKPGNNPKYVQITLGSLPQKSCLGLTQQLLTVTKTTIQLNCLAPKGKSATSYVGEF